MSKSQKKILHFITKFLNFSLKIKPGWSTWVLKPTLETRNVNDVWMVYFSWHKVLIWILKNQWLLNFNGVLLVIQLVEGLGILLSWPWKTPLPILLTFWREEDFIVSWNKIIHFAILRHLYMNILLFFLAISSRFELRVYGLWLISSMRLDWRKDIKPLKLIRLVYIWSLKPASYSLPTEIIRDVKQTHITPPQIIQLWCIFNEYEMQEFN